MKSPTNYGSENEETRFIRRVAAPDRPNNKRRQKKRLAIAGATLGLLAASAGVGYTAMKNASSTNAAVKTANLKADMSNEAKSFISKLGDAFHPDFDKIDQDHDGKLSKDEILADLTEKEMVDVDKVKASDLPQDIKRNVVALLESKLQSDGDCAKQALDQRQVAVSRADHEIFYYMLDVFCPRVTIAVTPPDQSEDDAASAENQQTVTIPTPDGGTTEVVIVGEPEDGKQTIAIPDGDGGYSTTEVRSIETPTGEQKILIPNAVGDITPVVVPDVPEEETETAEGAQVVDVVTRSGETEQVIIDGEPENGEVTVKIPDNDGGYTETEAKVEETSSGGKIVVETTDGDIIQVPVPEPVDAANDWDGAPNYSDNDPFTPEEPFAIPEPEPLVQTIDVVADDGEHQAVILVGDVEDGKQTVKIANDDGGYTTKEVNAVETEDGVKLVVPDAEGDSTMVEVPDVPAEVAEHVTDDSQVVNVVTPEGDQLQVVVDGEPDHGKQTVDIIDDNGEVTTQEVKAIDTEDGVTLQIQTDEGYVPVVVAEVPDEIKEEIQEQAEEQPNGSDSHESTEEQPVVQTIDVVADNGEHEAVILVGDVEDGKQTVKIANDDGGYTTKEVNAVETEDGVKLVVPDAEGDSTVVEVPDVPAEVAEHVTDDSQVVNVVTPEGDQLQVVVDGEPDHGKQTVDIIDDNGEVTTQEVKAIDTEDGVKLQIQTDEGYVPVVVAEVPDEIKEEIQEQAEEQPNGSDSHESTEEQPVVQTIDVVADNGEHEAVILVGDVEDGKQTVKIANDDGGYTTKEVNAVETEDGVKLVVPDAEGDSTVVEVPDVPAEVAEHVTDDSQVVNVVTPEGDQLQVVVDGELDHGKQTVDIIDDNGEVTTQEVKAIDTEDGVTLQIQTDEGYVPVVVAEVPDEIKEEIQEQAEEQPNGSDSHESTEEQPVVQTIDVVADNGEHEAVILVGDVEDGKQTVKIANDDGGYTTKEVNAVETEDGVKLVVPDAEGDSTVVEVPDVPAEVAEHVTDDSQVVNVVTPEGDQLQVVVDGEPDHGKQTVDIIDDNGEVTTQEVKAIDTEDGVTLQIQTDEGYVPVVVAEVPDEIKEEIQEQAEEQPNGSDSHESTEEQPVVQTIDVVADNGEHEAVILVGDVEDGKQTVKIANDDGGYTTKEVNAVETEDGVKLVVPDAEGDSTVVEVPDVPAEVAEHVTDDSQVVNVVTPEGDQLQVVVDGEPDHGKQTVDIIDDNGEVTTQEVKAIDTEDGVKLQIQTDEGYVPVVVAEVPDEIKEEIQEQAEEQPNGSDSHESTEEQPVVQTIDVVADNGEHEAVILVGDVEDGKQTVKIANDDGGYTTKEVNAVETEDGVKLVVPDAEGDSTVVEVPDVPAEVAEHVTDDSQVVNVVTPEGDQLQVVVDGELDHGKQTVDIIDDNGEVTTQEVKAIDTEDGVTLQIQTDEGYVPVVVAEVPDEIKEEIQEQAEEQPNGSDSHESTEEQPVVQTIDVVADNGEHEAVILVGDVEDGKQTVKIANDDGGYTTKEVNAVETEDGVKLVVPDAEGDSTVVEVPDVPAEVAEHVTDDSQVVNVVTPEGDQLQVVVDGEPDHGKQTVDIIDDNGEVTTQEVKAIDTEDGVKLQIQTDEGYVPVVVAEVPDEIKEEIQEQAEEQPNGSDSHESTEEQPVVQTIDVVADNGEHEAVILVGDVEDGKQTVKIANDDGGYTTKEVNAVETEDGVNLVVPDAEGDSTMVEVPDVPAEVAEHVTDDSQVVNVVTPEGDQLQVVVDGEPDHGKQTVDIIDDNGEVTTQEVKAIDTEDGVKLQIQTDEGYVPVVVAEVPDEIKEEIQEQAEEQPNGSDSHESTEEQPVVQTIDVVADNGEHEAVILVGDVEDGKQTVKIANDDGGYTTKEVNAVETEDGVKLVVPDAEGDSTVVEVPDVPAEVAEHVTDDSQVVNVVTPEGDQLQVVVDGEPDHGKQTVDIIDDNGEVTTQEVKAIDTEDGVKLQIQTDEGYVPVVVAEVPDEIKEEIQEQAEEQPNGSDSHESTEEQPVVQTIDVVADNGEHEAVILVGDVEDGKQTVKIANDDGGYTTKEVNAVETEDGVNLVVPDAEGDSTMVEVPDVPAEVAEHVTDDSQVVNVVTPEGDQLQVVVDGEPDHGKQTVDIIDDNGEVTTQEVKAIDTEDGVKLQIQTDEGYVPVVVAEVPDEIKEEIQEQAEEQPNGSDSHESTEEQPVVQTIDVVADNGEHEAVILVGDVEDGKQTVKIANDDGGYTTKEVNAVETEDGVKLVVPDAEGDSTVVEVPDVPAEVAEHVTDDSQVVNVVTPEGDQLQVVVDGEPDHGKQTVDIIDDNGEVTTQEVKAIDTEDGVKLQIQTDEGYVPVVVAEVPDEIKEEIQEQAEEQPNGSDSHESTEEQPVVQTIDVVADNGEHEAVILVGDVEDGKQTVKIANDDGGYTTKEVNAVETEDGVKLVVPDAEGDSTMVEVPDVPAEVAEHVTDDSQVVNVVTPEGDQLQVVVDGEPDHGKQTVDIIDDNGEVTTQEVKAIDTEDGVKLQIQTDEGYVPVVVAEVPDEIKEEIQEQAEEQPNGSDSHESTEEQPVVQTIDVVADNGEHEAVILVGDVEDGKQTVKIANDDGGYTTKEVNAVETEDGVKLVVPDAEGDSTVVEVPDVPAEVAEHVTDDSQVVNVVTPEGDQLQVVVDGEPDHGKQTVDIIDDNGEVTTQEVKAIDTEDGVKLQIQTDEGYVPVVVAEVPDEIKEEIQEQAEEQPNGSDSHESTEEQPVVQTIDVVADNGEHEAVILVGDVEDGKQTVKIANDDGGYTTKEVNAVETEDGVKLVVPDAEGDSTMVEVPDVPAEVAEHVTDDSQVVNVVTPEGDQLQVVVDGEPDHGKQTVDIIDDNGEVTTQEVKAIDTEDGVKLQIQTDEGYVPVVVAEVPDEIKEEIQEQAEEQSNYYDEGFGGNPNFMTKVEFRDWIARRYQDRLDTLKMEEEKLEEEERAQGGRVNGLEDCIEQASNKFGHYGVYEQPPHYQNAVDWVENECWTADQWEPESPPEHPMLRR